MDKTELKQIWKNEERVAHIHGWDFSHIHGRYEEEKDLPWDYKEIVEQYLNNSVNKNLDEALNTPSKIISKLEELNISDEEFELKFGFKKDYILALQDNKENRFGIASSDNLITGSNFISEEKIDSFISLIS